MTSMPIPSQPPSGDASNGETVGRLVLSAFVYGQPVSLNSMYGSRGGARFLTPMADAWREGVAAVAMLRRQEARTWRLPLTVCCTFYVVRGDIDNLLKLTLDGLALGVQIDDRHIDAVTARRGQWAAGMPRYPGAQIEVWEAPDPFAPDAFLKDQPAPPASDLATSDPATSDLPSDPAPV